MSRRIHLHIDEVVLRGLPPEEARRVAAALERGLTDHAAFLATARESIPPRAEASRRLDPLALPTGSSLGDALATVVVGAVAGPGGRP